MKVPNERVSANHFDYKNDNVNSNQRMLLLTSFVWSLAYHFTEPKKMKLAPEAVKLKIAKPSSSFNRSFVRLVSSGWPHGNATFFLASCLAYLGMTSCMKPGSSRMMKQRPCSCQQMNFLRWLKSLSISISMRWSFVGK